MHVLVTRPEPQASATASLLESRGHVVRKAPLSTIERIEATLPPGGAVDAVLLTSANAAPALRTYREKPVYAVGGATAEAARLAGASSVHAAGGDWQSLARLLSSAEGPPAGSRLLHLSGAAIAGDLGGAAVRAGFAYTRRVVYAARATHYFAPETIALLAREELDAVLFLSPAHATIWHQLVERAAVIDRLFPLRAVVLSAAVGAALGELPWREIAVADAPEIARLIDRLEAVRG